MLRAVHGAFRNRWVVKSPDRRCLFWNQTTLHKYLRLLPFTSPPGVWKRQLRETDALSHALFTALIPQPYKTENRRVCVYFIYLSNPQIDSCKMFLIKDSWPGIKWWSFALKGLGPVSVFLYHQKSQKIDTTLMSVHHVHSWSQGAISLA